MAQFGSSNWWNGVQPRAEIDRRVRAESSQFDRHGVWTGAKTPNDNWIASQPVSQDGPDFFGSPIDALYLGVFVVSKGGRVVWLNSAGERLIARDDGLRLLDQALMAIEPAESETIREAIARALECEDAQAAPAYTIARASRPSRIVPYVLLIARVDGSSAGTDQPAVLVAVEDPDQPVPDLGYELRTAFEIVEGVVGTVAQAPEKRERQRAMESFGEWIRFVRALARVFFKYGAA
jgi:hypothetical protein